MTDSLKIALVQYNFTVGAVHGNCDLIRQAWEQAKAQDCDLVMFSECCISGYPQEDLVLKPAFQRSCRRNIEQLAADTKDGPALLVGAPWMAGNKLYNSAILLAEGKAQAVRHKHLLPNYGVFDEKRVFAHGPLPSPIAFKGVQLGVLTCEDMWSPDVAEHLQEEGAEILLVMNGSPYEVDKPGLRHEMVDIRVKETGLPLVYLNQVGGQDELVFDGLSFVVNADGTEVVRMKDFEEDYLVSEWRQGRKGWECETRSIDEKGDLLESVWQAMMLGLKDYVEKNQFNGVILGLSGGIDSAVTLAVAVDALGADRVRAVMLPSKYTSEMSRKDAREMAVILKVRYDVVPIDPLFETMKESLAELFSGLPEDTTEENMQARLRANLLMAMSNKFDLMLVTTGNKSEISVGYATLYGDMCGGYSVLKDIYKTTVYQLAEWRNRTHPHNAQGPEGLAIPENIITRPPSAELKPDQTDQDSLPPYEVLDKILEQLIEEDLSEAEIAAEGYEPELVQRISRLVYAAEYKREQSSPGVKITSKTFGSDRRYPITNRFGAIPHHFEE